MRMESKIIIIRIMKKKRRDSVIVTSRGANGHYIQGKRKNGYS